MTELSKSAATLVFIGDDLIPDEITRLLGKHPSRSQTKGKKIEYPVREDIRIARYGNWVLTSEYFSPGDLNAQIKQLLSGTTEDLKIWNALSSKFRANIFCGLWLKEENEGIRISSATMKSLADRGLDIDFDIYVSDSETD